MKIDVHTHILPRDLPRWKDTLGEGGFIQLDHIPGTCRARMVKDDGTFFREIEDNAWDPARRLRECDDARVDVQVLSTVPVMFSYWARAQSARDVARFLNDHVAAVVAAHPRRFVALGTLPLQAPDLAIEELQRCMKLGMAGVQIGTHVNAWNLSAPELFPVFAEAAKLGAAIFVHPWDMMGQADMQKYWLPWLVGMPAECARAICSLIFGGVLERLPSLRVCIAHGGGAFPVTVGRVRHGFDARPDLVAVDSQVPPDVQAKRLWVDALVHDPRALRLVLEVFGDDRVVVGSDYPFPLGEARPGSLVEATLDPFARARIFSDNALAWLGLPRARFVEAS